MQEQLQSQTWQPAVAGKSDDEAAASIVPGDTVWLREANMQATVLSIYQETGRLELQAGRTRLMLSADGIERIVPSPGGEAPRLAPVKRRLSKRPVSLELDLRGKRADEIDPLLDHYLNDAYLANLSEVRIVHGVGTGVVRDIVRDLLASHPLVKSFHAGEQGSGGDGATIVEMQSEHK